MTTILEVVKTTDELLTQVYDEQRTFWTEQVGHDVVRLSLQGLSLAEAADRYTHAVTVVRPAMQLIRGADVLADIPLVSKIPAFLDHSTPYAIEKTAALLCLKLPFIKRTFCYSSAAREALKACSFYRTTVLGGPYLAYRRSPVPDRMTVAILRTCSTAIQILREVAHTRTRAHLDFDIVSTMQAPGVQVVSSEFEAARQASVLCTPMNDPDWGQPHMGAVLALATGKALATNRISALESLPYPMGTFLSVLKHEPRAYGTIATVLKRNPQCIDWAQELQYDSLAETAKMLTLMEQELRK